jgi:hypothetical protein
MPSNRAIWLENNQLSRYKIIGELAPKSGGEVLYGPVIIYSLIHRILKVIKEQISSFNKTKKRWAPDLRQQDSI